MKLKLAVVCALLLVTSIVLTGCGGGVGTLLKIAGVRALIPDRWTSSSRIIRIVADVISGDYVDRVIAKVFHEDDNTFAEIILTRNADGKYEGTFEAAPDTAGTAADTYTAVVTATDSTGNTATSEPITVEVPPAEPAVTSIK